MQNRPSPLNGFFIVDKPAGITSHDVIARVRRVIQEGEAPKLKVGHAGTLDPFATGVLIVAIGNATRLTEYVHLLPKTYEAEIMLGATSDTDDITGIISSPTPSPHIRGVLPLRKGEKKPTKQNVLQTLRRFTGTIQQIPPAYAAIKVRGKKLYEYAREGKHIERKPRTITIQSISMSDYHYPRVRITVTCSAGTYIRALARDIGVSLEVGAYLLSLRRTAIGPFTLQDAIPLNALAPTTLTAYLKTPEHLIEHLPRHILAEEQTQALAQGHALPTQKNLPSDQPIALLSPHGNLRGIGRYSHNDSTLRPEKVFNPVDA